MITYAIVVSKRRDTPPDGNTHVRVKPGDNNYKSVVLSRQLNRCFLKSNDVVRQKGSQKTGVVMDVIGDPVKCAWKDNIPYFVRVKWYGEEHTTLCPFKLLKKVSK